jgi:hypothetical protein
VIFKRVFLLPDCISKTTEWLTQSQVVRQYAPPFKRIAQYFLPSRQYKFWVQTVNWTRPLRVASMETKSFTIGLCLIFVQISFIQAVSVREFYPFSRFTDRKLPANDDGSSGELTLSVPFPFFKSKYQRLYVSRYDIPFVFCIFSWYVQCGAGFSHKELSFRWSSTGNWSIVFDEWWSIIGTEKYCSLILLLYCSKTVHDRSQPISRSQEARPPRHACEPA